MVGLNLSMGHFQLLLMFIPVVLDEGDDSALAFDGIVENLGLFVMVDTVRADNMIAEEKDELVWVCHLALVADDEFLHGDWRRW